jgi:hypothetical protein
MKTTATVADQILGMTSAQLPRRQLDLAVTVVMLQHGGYNALLGYKGVRERRYEIDHQLVTRLLNATKDHRIIQAPAFACLPGRSFRRLFFRYWRHHQRSRKWRHALGWALHVYLNNHPEDAPLFAAPIWAMSRDPDEMIAINAIYSMQHLGGALSLEQCEALIAFTHHDSNRAGAAMSSLGGLYEHIDALRPEVRELLLNPQTITTLRSANPPDGRDRNSCYGWCLARMRVALAHARGRRAPKVLRQS